MFVFHLRTVWSGLAWMALATVGSATEPAAYHDLESPPHFYSKRVLQDRFTRLKEGIEAGRVSLDYSGELPFLRSVLQALDVPASSQLLVFSTTSLQLSLISPSNPRALYFNEDVYVGYVPGGRVEVVSLDPEAGGIFYIFNIPADRQSLKIERSGRCMNCHAGEDTAYVPGLVAKSVIPGPGGGSLTAYRTGQSGHGIPFADRFGGWHVTGRHGITNHWGNLTGRLNQDDLTTFPNPPGERFRFDRFLAATSDILPHLLHEHQVGFVNRVVEASYRARTALHAGGGSLTGAQSGELDEQARVLTRYILFADEAPLPAGGVEGDVAFKADFLRNRRTMSDGASLKDFDLQTRMFRHRCSYMIYSPVFAGLPAPFKERVYRRMERALAVDSTDPASGHLGAEEKRAIQRILRATLTDLPADWGQATGAGE